MEQIRFSYRLVATCLLCLGFSVGMCSGSDASLIKTYVSSSSLPSNDHLVYSANLNVDKISESEWDSLVIKSEVPVMVMFTTIWCVQCRAMLPMLDKLDMDITGRFNFYTLNIEDEFSIAIRYNVNLAPTTIVFKGGEEVDRVRGFQPWILLELVEQYV